jgi:glycosyltransferase involved in cell wall biosynthesis
MPRLNGGARRKRGANRQRAMLTVLFATHNRVALLSDVLAAYERLEPPPGGWRLVVVDNASTDRTRDLLTARATRLPLTCLYEATPGKNAALNTGLAAVAGDLVVFTDDDAFPRPDWLVRLRAAADEHPSFTIFGGVVLPRWEVPPPAWILDWVPWGRVFTLTDPNVREGPTPPYNIFGPNMAIRAEIFAAGQRFDATIGPRGSEYAMGSETELVRRLLRQGHTAWHTRGAVVGHFIRASQMQRSWILRRAIRFGRGQYRLERAEHGEQALPPMWGGVPRYLFREMLEHALSAMTGTIELNAKKVFQARWDFNYARGKALEARALYRELVSASAPVIKVAAP